MEHSDTDSLRFLSTHARSLDPARGASLALEKLAVSKLGNTKKPLRVAGVDEAGRGPLAGPVVAAAVILDPENIPAGLADSKTLGEKKRKDLFEQILKTSAVAWSSLNAGEIDRINILQASLQAMVNAVLALENEPDLVLIDGRDVPPALSSKGAAIVKGDALSQSIAAASIIAKVVRDSMMRRHHEFFPDYGFASHKGYGSKQHLSAINEHGACPLHRMSFSPFKQAKCLVPLRDGLDVY